MSSHHIMRIIGIQVTGGKQSELLNKGLRTKGKPASGGRSRMKEREGEKTGQTIV